MLIANLHIILVIGALVLSVVELFRGQGKSPIVWAVVLLALALAVR